MARGWKLWGGLLPLVLFLGLGVRAEPPGIPGLDPQPGEGENSELLKSKLGQKKLQEAIEVARAEEYRNLPGGVFRAPALDEQVKQILSRFQKTRFVDNSALFKTFLASAPEINGWIRQIQTITDVKVFHVVLTKGILDALTDYDTLSAILGPELAAEYIQDSASLVAAVLAHELGHAMNGNTEDEKQTTRIYHEFAADEFAVKILAEAGYDPRAMTRVLEVFEKLHTNRSLQALLHGMLDEHPKSRFRIANIAQLTENLLSLKPAREELGFDASRLASSVRGPFRRSANEATSKTSLTGIRADLAKPQYAEKALREKLVSLEEIFTIRKSAKGKGNDGMARQAVVAVVEEYIRLVDDVTSLEAMDILINSLHRFELQVHDLAGATSEEAKKNVKGAFSRLKDAITQRQVDFLTRTLGSELNLENLNAFANELDEREVTGRLAQMVFKTKNLEDLKKIYFASVDVSQKLRARFRRTGATAANENHSFRHRIAEAVAVRALDLTKNMESTLDFMEEIFPLTGSDPPTFEGRNYVFAGLAQYLVTHDGVTFGNFHDRMGRPETARDRAFSRVFAASTSDTSNIFFYRRGVIPGSDVLSKTFAYGIGRRFHLAEPLTADTLLFLQRVLTTKSLHLIFNDLLPTHQTLAESLKTLAMRSVHDGNFWKRHSAAILDLDRSQAKHDPQWNLRRIEAAARKLDPEGYGAEVLHRENLRSGAVPAGPNGDVLNYYRAAGLELRDSVVRLAEIWLTAPYLNKQTATAATQEVKLELPQLSARILSFIPLAERPMIFEALVKLENRREVTRFAEALAKSLPVVEEGLEELRHEGKVTAAVKTEFFTALTEFSQIASDFTAGRTSELPEHYFVLRRNLNLMYKILRDSTVKFADKLPEDSVRAIKSAFADGDWLTRHSRGIATVNNFLVQDRKTTTTYLKDPSSTKPFIETHFSIAAEFARIVAYYDGIGDLSEKDNLHSLSLAALLARQVYKPAQPAVGIRGASYAVPDLDTKLLFGDEADILLPLGPAFRDLLVNEEQRVHSRALTNQINFTVIRDLWGFQLYDAVTNTDSIEALAAALSHAADTANAGSTTEEVTRNIYVMLSRSLELVRDRDEMAVYAAIFATYLQGHQIGANTTTELLNGDPKAFGDLSAVKYRELFYDRLAEKINGYGLWEGPGRGIKSSISQLQQQLLAYLLVKSAQYANFRNDKYDPFPFRMWFIKDMVAPFVVKTGWYQRFFQRIRDRLMVHYTKVLLRRERNVGRVNPELFLLNARKNTPWSRAVDAALVGHIEAGRFEGRDNATREKVDDRASALKLLKEIRSLDLRQQTYKGFLARHGEPKIGWVQKLKDRWALYQAYLKAKEVWTSEVLEDLRQAQTLLAAWKIKEKAWRDHASMRAAELGVSKEDAEKRLLELYAAHKKVESPFAAEVASVFPEASRHRDEFLETHAKSASMNFEQLQLLETFKSRETDSPYHKIAKGVFEFIDEYITKLEPTERAEVALYLADFRDQFDPQLEKKVADLFHGTDARRKAVRKRGYYFSLKDIKTFFRETHPEERMIAFRALFVGEAGISHHPAAERILVDTLLFADPEMPPYLRKLLTMYLAVTNGTERSILLSWLLSNGNHGVLRGPEVVRLIVEKGGVAITKLAQLVASHGFHLPAEYQRVLQVFKGNAQKVDKIFAMKLIGQRLPKEKYDQIKSLDRELGSGSLKLAYLATLKDGRRVVIKLAREYVMATTRREFEVLKQLLGKVMDDPEMRIDNLPGLLGEVERIIRGELNFAREADFERRHGRAWAARPVLVRRLGGSLRVEFPQPLEGWESEDVLVEEYISSRQFAALPESTLTGGWTKEKLAKGAIDEVLNQLLAYMNPGEHVDGGIVLDIDPHEDNQLASGRLFKKMVDIDLGQSVIVPVNVVEGFMRIVFALSKADVTAAATLSRSYMEYRDESQVARFTAELEEQSRLSKDPVEVLTKAIEETELEGIGLKPEYLYFQKLFATLVGLKSHVSDANYLMNRVRGIFELRAIGNPAQAVAAFRRLSAPADCQAAVLGR